ncbi:hypothetical protein CLOM_g4683 [Closterium sp. NIES-68]|nr:hypothetical protein CLOM_g4683 [Closterium sp. NIES-68]GJP57718.1 hypothetical protein CLOP_g17131 [Closterium sp. NIES-67]
MASLFPRRAPLLAAMLLFGHLLVVTLVLGTGASAAAATPAPLAASAPSTTVPPPVCPFTKQPPIALKNPPLRCPAAAGASCCEECVDVATAQTLVNADLNALLTQINPSLSGVVEAGVKVCSLFGDQPECPYLAEVIVCAAKCNPNSGSYVKTDKQGGAVMLICPELANRVYNACKGVKLGTFVLGEMIGDGQAFIDTVVVNTIKVSGLSNLNVTISNSTSCFAGAAFASTSPCDASVAVPPPCAAPGGSTSTTPPPAAPPPPKSAHSVAGSVVGAALIGLVGLCILFL